VKKQVIVSLCVVAALLGAAGLVGAVPQARPRLLAGAPSVVSYQGQVNLGGSPFDGKGYFKFAIVDPDGTTTYWCNDGSYGGGQEPEMPVQLIVTNGLFNVLLGDTSVENMTEPLDPGVFADPECYLRVWFSEDGGTFQQLSPDRRVAAVPYALQGERARLADYADEADSAATLDGFPISFFRNASNINAGTLSTDRFGAHADLSAEGYLGNGAGDLAQNNGVLQPILNADLVDGRHASALMVPSSAMLLGFADDSGLKGAGYIDLGPSNMELWRSTSTSGAPSVRYLHTAVWTGTEMIVWGGRPDDLYTGGRYDPATDTWTATTTTGAPTGRAYHTAVWTDSEMIVWGGTCGPDCYPQLAWRYDPATDTWTASTIHGAPSGREGHTAVWTGSEMIVWGGFDGSDCLDTGRRYDPASDTWALVSTTGAPSARRRHSAVWTGSEMIVWGGYDDATDTHLHTGGRYNPATNTWTDITTTDAPSGRYWHTAVWTGSEMMVWGGHDGSVSLYSGGSYEPATDTWSYFVTVGAPEERQYHTAVWSGSEMIVWGGSAGFLDCDNTGGRYNPTTRTWTDTSTGNAPARRHLHTAVWTGSEMIVWGGITESDPGYRGGRYSLLHLYQKP
jgi:hypothetical protein